MSKAHEMSRRGFMTAVGGAAAACSVGALAAAGAAAGSGETCAGGLAGGYTLRYLVIMAALPVGIAFPWL